MEIKLSISETENKQLQNQCTILQGLELKLQYGIQNKIQMIGQLEERNRHLQALIKERTLSAKKDHVNA